MLSLLNQVSSNNSLTVEVIAKVFNSGIATLRSQRQMAYMQSLREV